MKLEYECGHSGRRHRVLCRGAVGSRGRAQAAAIEKLTSSSRVSEEVQCMP